MHPGPWGFLSSFFWNELELRSVDKGQEKIENLCRETRETKPWYSSILFKRYLIFNNEVGNQKRRTIYSRKKEELQTIVYFYVQCRRENATEHSLAYKVHAVFMYHIAKGINWLIHIL